MAKLLIIEHDKCQAEALRSWFTRELYVVEVVGDGAAGLEQLCFNHFDVCIVNWRVPLLNAIELCGQYRSTGGAARVLMLAEGSVEQTRIQALDAGVDECVAHTCSMRELGARLRALLRRPAQVNHKIFQFNNCIFNSDARCVTRDGMEIRLQPKEYQLLEFLLRHPNHFFSAEALLRRVWDSASHVSEETVRTHVKTLRRKLDAPGLPSVISTSPGLGYRINLASHPELGELVEVAC